MAKADKRRMPVRTQRIEMEGAYSGFSAVMRVNIAMSTLEALYRDEDVLPTLASLVREWDFVDENGEPIPIGLEGLRQCPIDLIGMLKAKYGEALRSPLAATTSPASSNP